MQLHFPYGTSATQGSNMRSVKNSSTPFFFGSYSNKSQVVSSSGQNLNFAYMENSKT